MKRFYLFFVVISLILMQVTISSAQDEPPPLTITGTVVIIDDTTIQVGGISVDVADVTEIEFVSGMIITVTGSLQGTIVFPVEIIIETDPAEATPEVTQAPPETTPETAPTPSPPTVNINIVIVGPVQAIEANVVTIYGYAIELDTADIRTTVVQIGDVLRIGGRRGEQRQGRLFVIAIFYEFINVDVIVINGQLWRDYGDCAIVPPDWAYALAINWVSRCEVIIIVPGVPTGCRVTGMGGIKCSGRGSGMGSRGSGSGRSSR